MAKLYLLSPEQVKTGQRPKTPRQKQLYWRPICIILAGLVVLEHAALLYFKVI
jgi:hypothetical protein